MIDSGFIAFEGQKNLFNKLDIVSNNLANVNTAGFKQDLAVFSQDLNKYNNGRDYSPVPILQTAYDTTPGALRMTNRPLDVAVDGGGYLQVDTPLGPRYTRAGSLQVDAEGQLVTLDGFPVVGSSGTINIEPTDSEIKIGANGDVTASVKDGDSVVSVVRGTIGVFKFADNSQLQKVGNSLYTTTQAATAADYQTDFRIVQGALEDSNVNSVQQMSELVDLSRSVQNLANIIENIHSLERSAVQRVASVS